MQILKIVSFIFVLAWLAACSPATKQEQASLEPQADTIESNQNLTTEENPSDTQTEKRIAEAPAFKEGAASPANHDMSFSTHSDYYYCFCKNGNIVRDVEGFLSFGSWEDVSDELVLKYKQVLVKKGRGTYDNLGGADAPDWAYYDEHYYELEKQKQDPSQMEGFVKSAMADEDMILKPIDRNTWLNYCAESFKLVGKYPATSYVELNQALVKNLDKKALTEMRNEIYARHGLVFSDKETQDYFASKDWYKPQYDVVENLLSPIEKFNIEFIEKLL
ncbi:MAG: YARHG domain-containing protein [Bernardetiaceae bacterium]|nr:YARHG domain-containing protein [Bernardetiaceae bacterium]